MSGTTRRLVGALLFMPIIALVAVSQPASQWLLMALAALMVLEFSSMLALPMALRAALLMDFVLFALPAPIFAGIETTAGMPLDLVILALAALVVGLIWAVTRNGLASIFIALVITCILATRGLLGVEGGNLVLLALAAAVASWIPPPISSDAGLAGRNWPRQSARTRHVPAQSAARQGRSPPAC